MLDANKPNANTFDVDAMPRQRVSQRGYHQSFSSSTEISYPPKIATVSGPSTRQSSPTTIINITTDRQVPAGSRRIQEKGGCNCNSLLLSQNSPKSQIITPLWGFTPDWTPEWSEAEVEKEEARRLVWSSLILVAGHTSHAVVDAIHAREVLELWLTKAENVSLGHCPPPNACQQDGRADYGPHSTLSCILEKLFFPRRILDTTVHGRTVTLYGRCMREPSCCGIRV